MMLLRSTSIQLPQHSTNAADEKMQSAQGDEHVHQEEHGAEKMQSARSNEHVHQREASQKLVSPEKEKTETISEYFIRS